MAKKSIRKAAGAAPVSDGRDSGEVLDRLYAVVESRRNADPGVSHSARLLSAARRRWRRNSARKRSSA